MTTDDAITTSAKRSPPASSGDGRSLSIVIVGLLVGMAIFTGIHQATMPQGQVETADPKTLHLSGEFIESNLGSAVEADGSVTVRAIGQQYSFTPQCIVVPAGHARSLSAPPAPTSSTAS